MKKKVVKKAVLAFGIFVAIVTIFASCTKEVIEPGVVFTDEPKEELFEPGQVYGLSREVFITKENLEKKKPRDGYLCNHYWDQSQQREVSYECGTWYVLPVHKYWGILNGRIYVSKKTDLVIVYERDLIWIENTVGRLGQVIINQCPNCENPVDYRLPRVAVG